MIAKWLDAIPKITPTGAKAVLVLFFGACGMAFTALAQSGDLTGFWGTIAPAISFFLTGLAAFIDPNSSHA